MKEYAMKSVTKKSDNYKELIAKTGIHDGEPWFGLMNEGTCMIISTGSGVPEDIAREATEFDTKTATVVIGTETILANIGKWRQFTEASRLDIVNQLLDIQGGFQSISIQYDDCDGDLKVFLDNLSDYELGMIDDIEILDNVIKIHIWGRYLKFSKQDFKLSKRQSEITGIYMSEIITIKAMNLVQNAAIYHALEKGEFSHKKGVKGSIFIVNMAEKSFKTVRESETKVFEMVNDTLVKKLSEA